MDDADVAAKIILLPNHPADPGKQFGLVLGIDDLISP
jgi:hypothetical protein